MNKNQKLFEFNYNENNKTIDEILEILNPNTENFCLLNKQNAIRKEGLELIMGFPYFKNCKRC